MTPLDSITTARLMEELASRLAHSNGIDFVITPTLVFMRDCVEAELESRAASDLCEATHAPKKQ
jgi:hypothetical protein